MWKPYIEKCREEDQAFEVSEELSSVETFSVVTGAIHETQFQKNLVVWKPSILTSIFGTNS